MPNSNPIDLIALAAFLGLGSIVLAVVALKHSKNHKFKDAQKGPHKLIRGSSIGVMLGTAVLTFTAAWGVPWLYLATDHGFGLVLLAFPFFGGLGYCIFHILLDHPDKGKVKTPFAAACLGLAAVLLVGNITQIRHNLHIGGGVGSAVTTVYDNVHKNGR